MTTVALNPVWMGVALRDLADGHLGVWHSPGLPDGITFDRRIPGGMPTWRALVAAGYVELRFGRWEVSDLGRPHIYTRTQETP